MTLFPLRKFARTMSGFANQLSQNLSPYRPDCRGFVISIFHLFGIIGGVVVVVAGITITEAVVLRTDRPMIHTG